VIQHQYTWSAKRADFGTRRRQWAHLLIIIITSITFPSFIGINFNNNDNKHAHAGQAENIYAIKGLVGAH
jgi:hypothetical protein